MRQQDFPQHSSTLRPSTRHSINSPFVHRTFRQLPSTFCLSVENIVCGSWTFRLTSDNFQCGRGSFRQVFVCQKDLQSSSVNIPCSRELPSTCINYSCGCGTYRQLSVRPRGLPSNSVNFCTFSAPFVNIPCDHGIFRQLQSTFCAVVSLSANFCILSVRLRDLPSIFLAPVKPSVNFHQLSVRPRDLPWTFLMAAGPSIKFCVLLRTFCQLSSRQHNLASISAIFSCINFPCFWEIFRQFFVNQWDLL